MKRVIVRRVRAKRPGTPAGKQQGIKYLNKEVLETFNPSMLDLGDIGSPAQEIEAVTAVFDLSGFTKFCNHPDAYLAIPKFLNEFMSWFFSRIRLGLTEERESGSRVFWTELPMLVKFMGDGMLLLWNARRMTEAEICRLVTALYRITRAYRREFYPKISMAVDKPPSVLRCGMARGKVFSVGEGRDYVGHCINNASRLTQLGPLSFCFPHRGFQVQEYMPDNYFRIFIPKLVAVRGVGESERIWVLKTEFERLPDKNRELFREIGGFQPGAQVAAL